ncbi:unnamed protein product, partial [marine sediment metagenome]
DEFNFPEGDWINSDFDPLSIGSGELTGWFEKRRITASKKLEPGLNI